MPKKSEREMRGGWKETDSERKKGGRIERQNRGERTEDEKPRRRKGRKLGDY